MILVGQNAGALLAFSDLAAEGLDLAVGSPADVGVAARLRHGGQMEAVAARIGPTGIDVRREDALARLPRLLPRGGALLDLLDDPVGELTVVFLGTVRFLRRVLLGLFLHGCCLLLLAGSRGPSPGKDFLGGG